MARYRRRRRRFRRRRRRRRFRRRRRRFMSRINYLKLRRTTGFPDQMYVKLRYRQLNQYSGQGTQISQIYSMNSAYDPDQTAAGANNQPLTWDQWSQFYRRYQVMASSIHLRIITTAGSQRNGLVIYPSNSPTPAISPNNAIEQRYAKSYLI